ncbi:MAG: M23 family metallopeptidase [Chloroflexi bacterium]|nr:M23 family metallopeptidase [Chloroflexota bacterium]
MPASTLGVALQHMLTAAVRFLARTLVARVAEQMRDIHPALWWLIGGFIVMGALPVVAALLTGFVLQTAVYGQLISGDAAIDERATGSQRRAEIAASLLGTEPPSNWSWPVTGRLTALYGGCTFAMCPHWGTDIVGVPGTRVLAAADGVVAEIGWDPDGYGHYIILAHGGGWQTLYAHLQSPHVSGYRMKLNQAVLRGDPIGGLGSSGASTGPHLHLETRRNGVRVDPVRVIQS